MSESKMSYLDKEDVYAALQCEIERLRADLEVAAEELKGEQLLAESYHAQCIELLAVLRKAREFIATHPTVPDGKGWYQRTTLEQIDAAIAIMEAK